MAAQKLQAKAAKRKEAAAAAHQLCALCWAARLLRARCRLLMTVALSMPWGMASAIQYHRSDSTQLHMPGMSRPTDLASRQTHACPVSHIACIPCCLQARPAWQSTNQPSSSGGATPSCTPSTSGVSPSTLAPRSSSNSGRAGSSSSSAVPSSADSLKTLGLYSSLASKGQENRRPPSIGVGLSSKGAGISSE
jgi:hypothetical protein